MALYHAFLRPFFALTLSLVVSLATSLGVVWVARIVANVTVVGFLTCVFFLDMWLKRVWHILLVMLLTVFLTSVLFSQLIHYDDSLDYGLDAAMQLAARAIALRPTAALCQALSPPALARLCDWIPNTTLPAELNEKF